MIKYTEEKLKEVVKESQTFRQVLIYFNRNMSGASYTTLKKDIKKWNINISHFIKNNNPNKKKSNKNIFVSNSIVSRATVKKRIITDDLIKYKCDKCTNKGNWKGKELVLILDHKNGIRDDNRLENLRFLCPNCNSQEPTHCVGSKGLENKTTKEKRDRALNPTEAEINRAVKNRKVKNRPPKDKLLKELKTSNYTAIGRKYGVSDNCIRKWLK